MADDGTVVAAELPSSYDVFIEAEARLAELAN